MMLSDLGKYRMEILAIYCFQKFCYIHDVGYIYKFFPASLSGSMLCLHSLWWQQQKKNLFSSFDLIWFPGILNDHFPQHSLNQQIWAHEIDLGHEINMGHEIDLSR